MTFIIYVENKGAGIAQSLIATRYRLDGAGIKCPVGVRFSAPVQPGAHPASYTMGARSFPGGGVKQPGHDIDHSPPSSAEVKERVELYLYSLSGPSWPVTGELYL